MFERGGRIVIVKGRVGRRVSRVEVIRQINRVGCRVRGLLVTVETEPAPQVFTTQTRVATVEVDQVSEAVSYAFSQALRKHEASVATGVIESIRSMANQYLSSKGHQARI